MTSPASILQTRSAFDNFLFAPVGDDEKGMVVSVLSALARLDIDPWQEAGKLATLPAQVARTELASAISRLPDVPQARADPLRIAGRLVALLPASQQSSSKHRDWLRVTFAMNVRSRGLLIMLVLFALTLGIYVSTVSRSSTLLEGETSSLTQAMDAPTTPASP